MDVNSFNNMIKEKSGNIIGSLESPEDSVSNVPTNRRAHSSVVKGNISQTKEGEPALTRGNSSKAAIKSSAPAIDTSIVPKIDNMYGANVKQEADSSSFQYMQIPTQSSFQQKIEYV